MMAAVPAQPKIYHITHWRNLRQIVAAGRLWSDAQRIALGLDCEIVGMSAIKKRRLEELPLPCHPGTMVGQYVPFYFCPRSIMLYILHRANHPEVTYREGQAPIVHLQADLHETVRHADKNGIRWAFSSTNAGARYTNFYTSLDSLAEVNWDAVAATDFRDPLIKDGKQAEFLVFGWFPWSLVEKIGVANRAVLQDVKAELTSGAHQPPVTVEPGWYF